MSLEMVDMIFLSWTSLKKINIMSGYKEWTANLNTVLVDIVLVHICAMNA